MSKREQIPQPNKKRPIRERVRDGIGRIFEQMLADDSTSRVWEGPKNLDKPVDNDPNELSSMIQDSIDMDALYFSPKDRQDLWWLHNKKVTAGQVIGAIDFDKETEERQNLNKPPTRDPDV